MVCTSVTLNSCQLTSIGNLSVRRDIRSIISREKGQGSSEKNGLGVYHVAS